MNNIPDSQLHPPIISKKSRKLKFNEYTFIGDENPERVIRQRVAGSVSGSQVNFRTHPPVPNLLLSSKAWIRYTFTLSKFKDTLPNPTAVNFSETNAGANTLGDVILTKPFMAIANATTEARLSINGKGVTYRDPRYWQKYMGQLFCPESDIKKYYSTAGGLFPSSSGAYLVNQPKVDDANGSDGDPNFDMSADQTYLQYASSVFVNNTATITFFEPIYVGIFNWGYDIKERLPDKFWGKKMSNLIPYVRDLGYGITYDKLEANCFYYHYGQTSGGGFEEPRLLASNITSAELILQWVKPKDLQILYEKPYSTLHGVGTTMLDYNSMDIPPEVKLQSWHLNHQIFDVNGGIALADGTTTQLRIPVIHLYQIPSYVLMFATTDKDNTNYEALAVTSSDNTGGNANINFSQSSLEANPEINSIFIDVNSDRNVINGRFNQRELYNITLKNSKKDYPYDFSKYIGGIHRRGDYPGNMCVLFTAEDLNIPFTTGRLNKDFTFEAVVNLQARAGHYIKPSPANQTYKFHLIFLYDKYYMKINSKGDVDWRYESVY